MDPIASTRPAGVASAAVPPLTPPAKASRSALLLPGFRMFFITYMLAMMADNIEHVISYKYAFDRFHSTSLAGFAVVSHSVPFLLGSPAVRLNATARYLGVPVGPAVGGAMLLLFSPTVGIFINTTFYLSAHCLARWCALRPQVPQRTGDDRQHHVVDIAFVSGPDAAKFIEINAGDGEPAVARHPRIQRTARCHTPGEGARGIGHPSSHFDDLTAVGQQCADSGLDGGKLLTWTGCPITDRA